MNENTAVAYPEVPEIRTETRVRAIMVNPDRRRFVCTVRRPDEHLDVPALVLPGGRVEPGETPYEALTREVQEELGVTHVFSRNNSRLVKVCFPESRSQESNNDTTYRVELGFYRTDFDGVFVNKEEKKTLSVSWLTFEECLKMVGLSLKKPDDYMNFSDYSFSKGYEEHFKAQYGFFDALQCASSFDTRSERRKFPGSRNR